MKSKLIRAKITIKTEIVVENLYDEDPYKCVESAFRANKGEIVSQALESKQIGISNISEVTKKEHLPTLWTMGCLPWRPSISFRNKNQEQTISAFLKK